MTTEPIAAARHVATNTALLSIPVVPRMFGLTKMMYDIVRKVVRPATISVRTLEPCSSSLKNLVSNVLSL